MLYKNHIYYESVFLLASNIQCIYKYPEYTFRIGTCCKSTFGVQWNPSITDTTGNQNLNLAQHVPVALALYNVAVQECTKGVGIFTWSFVADVVTAEGSW